MTKTIGAPFFSYEVPDEHCVVVNAREPHLSNMIAWCIEQWGPTSAATWGLETLSAGGTPPTPSHAFLFKEGSNAETFQHTFSSWMQP